MAFPRNAERNREIFEKYHEFGRSKGSEVSFATLAKEYGLSIARIKDIYNTEKLRIFEGK